MYFVSVSLQTGSRFAFYDHELPQEKASGMWTLRLLNAHSEACSIIRLAIGEAPAGVTRRTLFQNLINSISNQHL